MISRGFVSGPTARCYFSRAHHRSVLHKIDKAWVQTYGRKYATSASQLVPSEVVSIPCPGNTSITLDIHYPKTGHSPPVRPAVTIFLPRGPILPDPAQDTRNVSLLAAASPYPVVKINYRYDAQFRFPTPVYDVMAGFDWVRENLLPKRSIARAGRSEHIGAVAVCGEFVGGQLAAVLALTECRIGEPGIVAAALNNPIVDWVSVENERGHISQVTPLSSSMMLRKREELFRTPEAYFDPFASPIHFFRTAGVSVPPAAAVEKVPIDDMDELALSERDDSGGTHFSVKKALLEYSEGRKDVDAVKPPRKASLRYPSVAFRLRLPQFHLSAGEQSPVLAQAKELASQLRRSLERELKANRDVSGTISDVSSHDEGPHLHQSPGLGLWDNSEHGRTTLLNTARWIAESIEKR